MISWACLSLSVAKARRPDAGGLGSLAQSSVDEPKDAARFLIQGTFGPTRGEVEQLSGTSFEDWISNQVLAPFETHREYYRMRVNPEYQEDYGGIGQPYTPCAKGSTWLEHAILRRDQGKMMHFDGENISIEGVFRAKISEASGSDSHARWLETGIAPFDRKICYGVPEVGGDLWLDTDTGCKNRFKFLLPNPAMWAADAVEVVVAMDDIATSHRVLAAPVQPCTLTVPESGSGPLVIQSAGKFFQFNARLELLENTPENPLGGRACAVQSLVEAQTCTAVEMSPGTVQGVTARYAFRRIHYGVGFMSDNAKRGAYLEAVVPDLNIVETPANIKPAMVKHFVVEWTGVLTIETEGDYTFWLDSTQLARMTIDGEPLDCTGRKAERQGSVHLTSGSHALRLDTWLVKGELKMVVSWQGPDSSGQKEVLPAGKLSTRPRSGEGCSVACGSPGEVPNSPALGHRMHAANWGLYLDGRLNGNGHQQQRMSKSIVWVNRALKGTDQLRQRMAWALSQILVVSIAGINEDRDAEFWLHYYDIFVRHGLGNYRDVLTEVVYSPLMGDFLTHTGSSSHDSDGTYPNENLARELMQLFTVGLFSLSSDGTALAGDDGGPIASFDNENILAFARVLTGFRRPSWRENLEKPRRGGNLIDPLVIDSPLHDTYPKQDLKGGYIGDGFPLCADVAGKFFAKGARYEARPSFGDAPARALSEDSQLFSAVCGAPAGSPCTRRGFVKLEDSLACSGEECGTEVAHVEVSGLIYEYAPPACVSLSLEDPGDTTTTATCPPPACWEEVRYNPVNMPGQGRTREESPFACQQRCASVEGCKHFGFWPDGGCHIQNEAATEVRAGRIIAGPRSCGDHPTVSAVKPWAVYATIGPSQDLPAIHHVRAFNHPREENLWILVWHDLKFKHTRSVGVTLCADREVEKRVAKTFWGLVPLNTMMVAEYWDTAHGTTLATSPEAKGHFLASLDVFVSPGVVVDGSGRITLPGGANPFVVQWSGEIPAAGEHGVEVTTELAIDSIEPPLTAEEALSRLAIGALPPAADTCIVGCGDDDEVAAYGSSGTVDAETVFGVRGKFFRNMRSVIRLTDGPQSFRNPPSFLSQGNAHEGHGRAAYDEVSAFLDHLLDHDNTPVFVGALISQRLGTSTPSRSHMQGVAEAFATGTYNGRHSGRRGDLAATASAILLHPEARVQETAAVEAGNAGGLREPFLKFLHLLRSMEYTDSDPLEQIIFNRMQSVIGQFPFEAPSVFNYYLADFDLATEEDADLPSEEEEEAEEDPEETEEDGEEEGNMAMFGSEPDSSDPELLAPELMVLTPQLLVGYLNTMMSLANRGVTGTNCGPRASPGVAVGVAVRKRSPGRWENVCDYQAFTWESRGGQEQDLEDLDLLLTGGRMSLAAKEAARWAYEGAEGGSRVKQAWKAIALSAEFNSLGPSEPLEEVRVLAAEPERDEPRSYKALVLLFLQGGADSFNILLPSPNCPLYEEYTAVRGDVALGPGEVIEISAQEGAVLDGQPCEKFAVHKSLHTVVDLYKAGEAAFVTNVGNLAAPGAVKGCIGGFSHSNQLNGALTCQCQTYGNAPGDGVGGRVADALATGPQGFTTETFSLQGQSVWPRGAEVKSTILGESPVVFDEYETWRTAMGNMTKHKFGNPYAEAYANALVVGIGTTEMFSALLSEVQMSTDYPTKKGLNSRLREVARVIATRGARKVERDLFLVEYGSFDHHSNVRQGLTDKLTVVNEALSNFVAEMKGQEIWDLVTVYTVSEFARTLDSNSGGTDHAWAGNQIVMGGAVNGGRLFHTYQAKFVNSSNDLGRGRFVPQWPFESFFLPLARWIGVDEAQDATVFPNVANFDTSTFISTDELFSGWTPPPTPPLAQGVSSREAANESPAKSPVQAVMVGVSDAVLFVPRAVFRFFAKFSLFGGGGD